MYESIFAIARYTTTGRLSIVAACRTSTAVFLFFVVAPSSNYSSSTRTSYSSTLDHKSQIEGKLSLSHLSSHNHLKIDFADTNSSDFATVVPSKQHGGDTMISSSLYRSATRRPLSKFSVENAVVDNSRRRLFTAAQGKRKYNDHRACAARRYSNHERSKRESYFLQSRLSMLPARQQSYYSTTRQQWLAEGSSGGDGNKSYLDSFQSQTSSWWKKAVEGTSTVAKGAASKTLDTSKKMAQEAALKTQQLTLDAAHQVGQSASKLSHSAMEATKEHANSLTKATTDSLSKASQAAKESLQQQVSHASKATTATLSKATESVAHTTQQAYHRSIQQPLQKTSKDISDTAEKLVDNLTSSGTKLLRYVAGWSLVAVFVYGIATTLPIQLIKYYGMEKKRNEDVSKPTTTAGAGTPPEDSESSKRSLLGKWWT